MTRRYTIDRFDSRNTSTRRAEAFVSSASARKEARRLSMLAAYHHIVLTDERGQWVEYEKGEQVSWSL